MEKSVLFTNSSARVRFYFHILSAASMVLMTVGRASADITWNWSATAGQNQGTFTTTGSFTGASLPSGIYTITDVHFLVSPALPRGSISDGTYATGDFGTIPPYTIDWNGSAVISIDAASSPGGINGLGLSLATHGPSESGDALFGTDDFADKGPGDYSFHLLNQPAPTYTQRGTDLTVTPVPTPEPGSMAILISSGAIILARRRSSK